MNIILVLGLVATATADFDCVCNYNDNYPVLDKPTANTDTLGYLFEFDCNEKLPGMSTAEYTAIAYEHQVGYIETNSQTKAQMCPGDPSSADILTTTQNMQFTTEMPREMPTTATMPPTTETPTTMIPSTTELPTTTRMPTTTQMPMTKTMVPSMTMTPTTAMPSTGSSRPSVDIFVTSKVTPMPFEQTTTSQPMVQTSKPVVQDNLNMCSQNLRDLAKRNHYAIGQFNESCYLLRTGKVTWSNAESYCKSHGGHLIDISNAQKQRYVMSFLTSHRYTEEIWIGLQDKSHEEQFTWASGEDLTYTNWYPYRKDDIDNHNVEDCAVLVPFAPFNGQWDDVHCGRNYLLSILGKPSPEHTHSFICQFGVHHSGHQTFPGGIIG